MSVQVYQFYLSEQSIYKSIPQQRLAPHFISKVSHGQLDSLGQAYDAGYVLRTRAPPFFLRSAMQI